MNFLDALHHASSEIYNSAMNRLYRMAMRSPGFNNICL